MKTIIFDMDGTLIDSGDIIADTINYVRSHFDLQPLEKLDLLCNVNNPEIHPPLYFYEVETYSQKHIELFESFYHQNFMDKIRLYDGIFELLSEFSNHFRYAIATNAHTLVAKNMVKHLKIDHHFEKIVGADDVKNAKPHPDMICKILQDLNLEKDDVFLIGDSKKDALAASNAGIDSLLVNWGFSEHDEAISDISELKNILRKRK